MFTGDLLALFTSLFVAGKLFMVIPLYTTFYGPNQIPVIELLSLERLAVSIGVFWLFRQMGHYSDRIHYFFQLRSIFICCCLGIVAESVLRLYLGSPTSTLGIIIAWSVIAFSIMCFRVATANFVCSKQAFLQPVILLNNGSLGRHATDAIARKPKLGYRTATLDEAGGRSDWDTISQLAIAGGDPDAISELTMAAASTSPNALFLYGFDTFNEESVAAAARALKNLDRPYGFVTRKFGIRLADFKPFPFFGEDLLLLLPDAKGPSLLSRGAKRLFDILAASAGLILLAPFFGIATYLIRRDGGPAYFKQERIGRNGRSFQCLKFRSMAMDAEERLQTLLRDDPEAKAWWDTHQKLKEDPRITKTGKWLRPGSLDEFPQLINVLRGEMSIIGPRPCFREQAEHYGKRFESYLAVRPGITGLWQVSGRNNTTFEERAELEAWYVDNWSLWLDLFILIKTVPVVLLKRGAS